MNKKLLLFFVTLFSVSCAHHREFELEPQREEIEFQKTMLFDEENTSQLCYGSPDDIRIASRILISRRIHTWLIGSVFAGIWVLNEDRATAKEVLLTDVRGKKLKLVFTPRPAVKEMRRPVMPPRRWNKNLAGLLANPRQALTLYRASVKKNGGGFFGKCQPRRLLTFKRIEPQVSYCTTPPACLYRGTGLE